MAQTLGNGSDVGTLSANGIFARLQQLLPPLPSPKRSASPPRQADASSSLTPKSKCLKIRIVTWNMHDSLPKGTLEDLLGPVPVYVEREVENDEERFMLPGLSLDEGHPYHLVIVGGQECPTLSGIPMGLAANFKHKEPKNREPDKERSNDFKGKGKGRERQSIARAETLLRHLKHDHFHHHHHHHHHHHEHNNMQPGDNPFITSGWSAVLEDWFSNGVGSLTGVKPVVTTGPVEVSTPSTPQSDSLPGTEAPSDAYRPGVIDVNWETTDSRGTENRNGRSPTAVPLHKGPYRLLVKDRLMGIYVAIFAHRDIYPLIKGVSTGTALFLSFDKYYSQRDSFETDTVPTGLIGGRLGNKGGVGVSMNLNGTRLLFINAHLAAHDGNTALRIANLGKIKAELTVDPYLTPNDSRLLKEDPTEKFDYTWIFGDLNFRLDITRLHADWLISKKDYSQALAFDQLNKLIKNNDPAFRDFREAKIDFPPTFKYDVPHRKHRFSRKRTPAAEEPSSSDVDESTSSTSSEAPPPVTRMKVIDRPKSPLLLQIASKTKFALVDMRRRMKLKNWGSQNLKTNRITASNVVVEPEPHPDRPVSSLPEDKSQDPTGHNSNCYDSSSKQRVPSWCDRIIWRTTVQPEPPRLEDDARVQTTTRLGRMLRPFRVYTADSYTFERQVRSVTPKTSSRSLFSKAKGRTTSLDLQPAKLATLVEEQNSSGHGSIPRLMRSRSVLGDGELVGQPVCTSDSVSAPNRPTALARPPTPPSSAKWWSSQLWSKETRELRGISRSNSLGLKRGEKNQPPRRGELVCLSYHTLDDDQMARLEGKLLSCIRCSDHRPVIGSQTAAFRVNPALIMMQPVVVTSSPVVNSTLLSQLEFANVTEKTLSCLDHLLGHKVDHSLYPSQYPASKRAAVLVVLYEKDGLLNVLLTTRSKSLRAHPYQTALPGGKFDNTDTDLVATALREANEEIAFPLNCPHLHVLCQLRPFVSLFKLFVTPIITFLTDLTVLNILSPSPVEVDAIFDHPLEAFIDPKLAASAKPLVDIGSENWPYPTEFYHATDNISPLSGGGYRMHRFRSSCTPIKGLTADILINVAEIAYNRGTSFERCPPNQVEPVAVMWSLSNDTLTRASLRNKLLQEYSKMAPITFTSEPPRCITIPEHRQLVSSTPESFSDIPPVLYHKEENLSITLDPLLQGFTEQDCAKGTLYIVESALFFLSVTGKGIRIEYPTITLHAVARGDSVPKVYCQLSEREVQNDNEENEEDDDMRELNLIPSDVSSVEGIFEALSTCAAMHPDPQEDEDDLDDAFIDANENEFETFNGDDQEELSAVGRAALDYLESIIEDPLNLAPSSDSVDPETQPNLNGINGQKR